MQYINNAVHNPLYAKQFHIFSSIKFEVRFFIPIFGTLNFHKNYGKNRQRIYARSHKAIN